MTLCENLPKWKNRLQYEWYRKTPSRHPLSKSFPTRALILLIAIGVIDLMTAILHANGLIIELNPLMRPIIEHSEWSFAVVKGLTLFAAWFAMVRHSKTHLVFIRHACVCGSLAYLFVWTMWFTIGSL
jgi:hypothetical protein